MNITNRQLMLSVAVVAVVGAAAAAFLFRPESTSDGTNRVPTPYTITPSGSSIVNGQPAAPTTAPAAAPASNTSATLTLDGRIGGTGGPTSDSEKLSYEEALAAYQFRFYFGANCASTAGIPIVGKLNMKQGTALMMNNTDSQPHRIALGNEAVTVAAGDYAVLITPVVTETTGLYLTCDGKGAGNIFVEP